MNEHDSWLISFVNDLGAGFQKTPWGVALYNPTETSSVAASRPVLATVGDHLQGGAP